MLRPAPTSAAITPTGDGGPAYRRVLVAVGSGDVRPAVELAIELAAPNATMVLARVHRPSEHDAPFAYPDDDLAAAVEAVTLLRAARGVLGTPCELVAAAAPTPADGLRDIAEREAADLLVVGAHADRPDEPAVLPAIVGLTPCDVAIAGQRPELSWHPVRSIGFGHEATREAEHAGRVARALATDRDATLSGMHVVPVTVNPWFGATGQAVHTLLRLDGALADAARAEIEHVGHGVVPVLREGDAVHHLLAFADALDLLVIGARPAGRLRRGACGEVAAALSVQCPCALLVTAP